MTQSQLYRLAEVAEHPKTTIQVIRSAGAHAGLAFIAGTWKSFTDQLKAVA